MQITISKEWDGRLLRDFLRAELNLSAKMLKYLKYRNAGICVNGTRCTVRYVLREGDLLTLETEDRASSPDLLAVELPLDVLYEDDDLVVPSKPCDMPTHPSHDHHNDTVANALAFRYAQRSIPFVFRPINRLDRNTSGLLLVARNKTAAGRLTQAMQAGEIRKQYVAVLDGEMRERTGEIDVPLHRTKESIILREVCTPDAPDADPARTLYTVLAVENGHTLVSASPVTGRTHQLRVHFASIGHPITGDDLYGTPTPLIPRHALHARTLSFPHPTTGERMTLNAPLAPDMDALIHTLFPTFWNALTSNKEVL
ncbi:MAG: RluA family pseudouridine synthase [Clostridia bacterium]|nr:RluA family pseudouridine synthase [Clostridia bacterium]